MCGLTGYLQYKSFHSDTAKTIAQEMSNQIIHRGPDSSGIWMDADVGIALAHRRLSIVDLSPAGHQPMESISGRYILVFNGEIYNHEDIRKELEKKEKISWRGHSDTETLLASIEVFGFEATLKKTVGMFAIALWDRKERTLYLSRDRMGEKPLYYGWQSGVFLFSSELKPFKRHPAFKGEIDRNALALYLRHNYIPAPYSIYIGISKLTPGTYLKITDTERENKPIEYWSLKDVVAEGQKEPFQGTEQEAIDVLDTRLGESVKLQMMADVPLGAFLSGGIDSSTIVALMQAQSTRPVKTFTIGFHEEGYNEAVHAKAVAKHIGTEHTELYVKPEEAMQVIPKLSTLYDEPFSDSSQIPTFLVSQLARQHVTVSLSGDAGDELFGGYNRYFWANSIWKKIGKFPTFMRTMTANTIQSISPATWNRLFSVVSRLPLTPQRFKISQPGDKMHKLSEILSVKTPESIYHKLVSHWKRPEEIVIGSKEPKTLLTDPSLWSEIKEFEHRMMYLDALTYLPDDILVKVDRAAMGVSLESRVPLLDHRVIELAWKIPLNWKIKNGQGKWLLRQVLYKYVPKELIERPKMGFGVPIDSWLRGPLKSWASELLNESRIKQEDFFENEPIQKKWKEHQAGEHNWQYYLWDILMFQSWLEKNNNQTTE
jgi:asparagine synthase (glutamine-hydrolysing)